MNFLIPGVIGYIFGCLNMAAIIAFAKGKNIKAIGTGNAGASNVYISIGKSYGIAAAACDILKGYMACLIVAILFEYDINYILMSGIFTVLGHIFPFWMKFAGGKGLAAMLGFLAFVDIKYFALTCVILIAVTLITDYIALGTISTDILFSIFVAVSDYTAEVKILFFIMSAIIIFKHIENIRRISDGREIGFLRKNKKKV